jgi:LuxR family maltose regulon positive regulatory protein
MTSLVFFCYLIAALQRVHSKIGVEILSILDTDADLSFEQLLTILVNDIVTSGENFVLVLDDYLVISEIKIHRALDFLFDHIPPGMHLVILSRIDPPMPLGRLRVQREMVELREVDLKFTQNETTTFLNNLMGLGLPSEDIRKLETLTEGWVAGLQLAAVTLHERKDRHDLINSFSGSHRHLIQYLVHEVLSRQPDDVSTFLLYTSVLEQFNSSLCDALIQDTKARKMLNQRIISIPKHHHMVFFPNLQ